MGRYDKIRVFNGKSWVQPSRIRVYRGSGSEVDLGTNTSFNTNHLYVRNNSGVSKRATLYRKDTTTTTTTGEDYLKGSFYPYPGGYWCWNPRGDHIYQDHVISGTIRKTQKTNVVVITSGNASNSCNFEVLWDSDGYLHFYCESAYYSGARFHLRSKNAVGINQWVNFEIRGTDGGYYTTLTFNGETVGGYNYNTFALNPNTMGIAVGATPLDWKGYITLHLGWYKASTVTTEESNFQLNASTGAVSYSMDTPAFGEGNTFQWVRKQTTSTTTTSWL